MERKTDFGTGGGCFKEEIVLVRGPGGKVGFTKPFLIVGEFNCSFIHVHHSANVISWLEKGVG